MHQNKQSLNDFLTISQNEFDHLCSTVSENQYDQAIRLIQESRDNGGRVHITGIGKPAHVAVYIASLLSSTGTPCYVLHGTEAVHGSSGQVIPGDVVICISNSGETAELKATVTALKNNGAKIIGVTGNMDSWLAKESDTCLFAGVQQEGGALNRAPRTSILAEILILQGLSILLQNAADITPEQYVRWHPGGTLGKLK